MHSAATNPTIENWPTQPFPVKTPPTGPRRHDARRHQQDDAGDRKVLHRFLGPEQYLASGPFESAPRRTRRWSRSARRSAVGTAVVQPAARLRVHQLSQRGNVHPAGAPVPLRLRSRGRRRPDGAPALRRRAAGPGSGQSWRRRRVAAAAAAVAVAPAGLPIVCPAAHVSCVAPPYGALVAVNVNTGDIAWSVPLGINENSQSSATSDSRPASETSGAASRRPAVLCSSARRSIVVSARSTRRPERNSGSPNSGERQCDAMTYMGKDGAQYVVIAAAGGGPAARGLPVSDALVAFKLAQ